MDIFSNPGDQPSKSKIIELPEDKHEIRRVEINDRRHYEVKDENGEIVGVFPSVTSILGATKDQNGLDKWRAKVGHEQAERIGKDATDRGTVMHRLCELYCNYDSSIPKDERIEMMLEEARDDEEVNQFDGRAIVVGSQLFYNFYLTDFFDRIDKGIFQEKFLWTKIGGGFAGTVDNFSLMDDGMLKIVDFKTARKPKLEKYIEGYKMQCAAYAIAIWDRYNVKPDGAEIWISNEKERFPQCFTMNSNDIKTYFKMFTERLEQFRNMTT